MIGIEQAYCNVCVRAVLGANLHLMQMAAKEAVASASAYGKDDTLALDAVPEITIKKCIDCFDERAVLVTEELGGQLYDLVVAGAREPTTLFLCDPTDRSTPLRKFLDRRMEERRKEAGDGREAIERVESLKVGEILSGDRLIEEWEADWGAPASVTGAVSAITCVRVGQPVFSVLLNYITQEIVIVSAAGIVLSKLPPLDDPAYGRVDSCEILKRGRQVAFPPLAPRLRHYDDQRSFVTFLGKSSYPENLQDCGIFGDGKPGEPLYALPGGPMRFLYLSELLKDPVGFIVANGEKLGEWVSYLAAARCARYNGDRILRVFEITHDRPRTKEGVLMAPSPWYSIFRMTDAREGRYRIDLRQLCNLRKPSQFRSTLVVCAADNDWVMLAMKRSQHRELKF